MNEMVILEKSRVCIFKAHALPCLSNEHDQDHPPRRRRPRRTRGASLAWCEVAAGSIGVAPISRFAAKCKAEWVTLLPASLNARIEFMSHVLRIRQTHFPLLCFKWL